MLAPSRYDNSPYTVVEALASGLAVIATNAGGAPEYLAAAGRLEPGGFLEGAGGRIVRPGDAAGLQAALEQPGADQPNGAGWLSGGASLAAVQTAARAQALGLCSPAQVAAETVRLYEQARGRIF